MKKLVQDKCRAKKIILLQLRRCREIISLEILGCSIINLSVPVATS